ARRGGADRLEVVLVSISLAWSQAFRKQETLVRGLINFAIGVAAFAFTCIGLHAVLPSPNIDEVSDKLRFFAQHKDEFDTLFLGSSRTYHEVSPPIFDQVMRDNGTPRRLVAFHASQFQKDFTNLGRASDIWDYFCCRDKART